MPIHELGFDDFREEEYHLIGIHTTLEDFNLAYLLNNSFKTQFKRASFNLDFDKTEGKASFSVYDYINEKYDFEWYLIANISLGESAQENNTLLFTTETKTYLIPEKKKVDFFIKIIGEADYDYIKRSVEKINQMPQVITSYIIDTKTLKSKDHLIF